MTQTTTRKDTSNNLGPIRSIKTYISNHCPHWKRHIGYGEKGHAKAEFSLGDYQSGLHLSIDAEERLELESGRDSIKRVMIQLDEEAVRQLYAILHERFAGAA